MIDYYSQLKKMREYYNAKRPEKLKLHRPWWIFADEELSKIYRETDLLLNKGQVYYAYLLQANSNLFKSFPPFDYPAQIVYSTDLAVDKNPLLLADTVEQIYSYKYSTDTPPEEIANIVSNIQDEKDSTPFFLDCVSGNCKVRAKMQVVMVYRKHLPSGILHSSVFPIIAAPDICDSVLILPKAYWTKEFEAYWLSDLM